MSFFVAWIVFKLLTQKLKMHEKNGFWWKYVCEWKYLLVKFEGANYSTCSMGEFRRQNWIEVTYYLDLKTATKSSGDEVGTDKVDLCSTISWVGIMVEQCTI